MHRSGTSATTGLLNACGAYVGDATELTEPGIQNPKGFFERRDVRAICDSLLHAADADWWKVLDFDIERIPSSTLNEQKKAISRLVEELDAHGTWALKEPRLCFLLPLYQQFLKDPVAIFVARHPVEVAESLRHRNGFPRAAGLALWEAYVVAALRNSADMPRVFLSYRDLISDPPAMAAKVGRNLAQLGVAGLKKSGGSEVIDPFLHRERVEAAYSATLMSAEQQRLWDYLRTGTAPPNDLVVLSPAARATLMDFEVDQATMHRQVKKLTDASGLQATQAKLAEAERETKAQAARAGQLADNASDLRNETKEASQRRQKAEENCLLARAEGAAHLKRAERAEARAEKVTNDLRDARINLAAKTAVLESAGKELDQSRSLSAKHEEVRIRLAETTLRTDHLQGSLKKSEATFAEEKAALAGEIGRMHVRAEKAEVGFSREKSALKQNIARLRETAAATETAFAEEKATLSEEISRLNQTAAAAEAAFAEEKVALSGEIVRFRAHAEKSDAVNQGLVQQKQAYERDLAASTAALKSKEEELKVTGDALAAERASTAKVTGALRRYSARLSRQSPKLKAELAPLLPDAFLTPSRPDRETTPFIINVIRRATPSYWRSRKAKRKREHKTRRDMEFIAQSGMFDKDWYLTRNLDVARNGMDPLYHYVRYGGFEGRDPSPRFSSGWYLSRYEDVKRAGQNPLVHYLRYGREEKREPCPSQRAGAAAFPTQADAIPAPLTGPEVRVEVIVPVFNALDDVKRCLTSLRQHDDGVALRTIVVNDGSNEETTAWLRWWCRDDKDFRLIEHETNLGFTKAVNNGLKASTAPYVISLNSDTIVTGGWLSGLLDCAESDPKIGIVGPLSNAATWQNVPYLVNSEGTFAFNELPPRMDPDQMAEAVKAASARRHPRTPFVNGFCFMIKRPVIDAIGFMDEENFPTGYGEENDYCLRAAAAGFELAIADSAYVYHAQSKSFGHDQRKRLSRDGAESLFRKHTKERVDALVSGLRHSPEFEAIRVSVRHVLQRHWKDQEVTELTSMRVLFLLPVIGTGAGGVHAIIERALEMRRLGIHVKVAVQAQHYTSYIDYYYDLPNIHDVFTTYKTDVLDISYIDSYDVAVATIFLSVKMLKQVCDAHPHILPAYFVQDYEPLFFPSDNPNHQEAKDSYSLVPNATLFAKTRWIADRVHEAHGVEVHKIEPNLDHDIYRPRPAVKPRDGRIHLTAMIRPKTPRRGAARTMRVLSRLAKKHGDGIRTHLFGCAEDDQKFQALPRDFAFSCYGVLSRPQVADLLAKSDLFLDLSDYQAYGRTALEAMACGCAALVPAHGGADEYVVDRENAVVVDTLDEDVCFSRIDELINNPQQLKRLQSAGLHTAARYSIHRAAISVLTLFADSLAKHRTKHPLPAWGPDLELPAKTNEQRMDAAQAGPQARQQRDPRQWLAKLFTDQKQPTADLEVEQLDRDFLPIAERIEAAGRPAVVVVPVYNAVEELERCLSALLAYSRPSVSILLIDDASPDARVRPLLERVRSENRRRVKIYRNRKNLGFTATVNRGFALAGDADVLILNADTEPTPRFVENMRLAAYSGTRVGTATALSDNAGAFSAPISGQPNPLPENVSPAEVQRILLRASSRSYPEVATGSGFCLYVRRDCLDETGPFDAEAFPRGYGEENDFCRRAAAKGWTHVIDDATFIRHVRSASFGEERQPLVERGLEVVEKRWPEYREAVRRSFSAPALQQARTKVGEAVRDATASREGRSPRALFVVSTRLGGTPQTNQDLMSTLTERMETFVLFSDSQALELFQWRQGDYQLLCSAQLSEPLRPFPHSSRDYDRIVADWLVRYGIELVHARHMLWHGLGLPRIAKALGIPIIFSFHDYYALCPTIRLFDEMDRFCAGHCTNSPGDCKYEMWKGAKDLPRLKHGAVHDWRAMMAVSLGHCDAFITTSPSARDLVRRTLPLPDKHPFHVIPHGRDFESFASLGRFPEPGEPLRILVPGNMSASKGGRILIAMQQMNSDRRLEFHLMGRYTADLKGVENLFLHGEYDRARFRDIAEEISPHIGAVLSIWPETWCHTLTELWAAGLPVVAYDFGALGERLRAHGGGWLLSDTSPECTMRELARIAADPAGFQKALREVQTWQEGDGKINTCAKMADRYWSVYSELAPFGLQEPEVRPARQQA
jgi:GT2 family glycosyltransferase/glycosyltransferase involved in cell wall biosynthesis